MAEALLHRRSTHACTHTRWNKQQQNLQQEVAMQQSFLLSTTLLCTACLTRTCDPSHHPWNTQAYYASSSSSNAWQGRQTLQCRLDDNRLETERKQYKTMDKKSKFTLVLSAVMSTWEIAWARQVPAGFMWVAETGIRSIMPISAS